MKSKDKQAAFAKHYLAKRGYDYDALTFEQQRIVAGLVRSKRNAIIGIIAISFAFIVTVIASYTGHKSVDNGTRFLSSPDVIFYAIVAEDYEQFIEPKQVSSLAQRLLETAHINGIRLGIAFFLFLSIMTAIMQQREKSKLFDAFFPDKESLDKECCDGVNQ